MSVSVTDPSAPGVLAVFTSLYKEHLTRVRNDHPLDLSVEDACGRTRIGQRFQLLHVGDGCSRKHAYVRFEDDPEQWVQLIHLSVVTGSLRAVPRRGRIHMGRTSLMGIICHGIRSGRCFRGR